MSVNELIMISKTQNWWPKQNQTGAIFLYALLQNIYSNFYFGSQTSCLVKFGERGKPTCPDLKFEVLETITDTILWPLIDMLRRWFRLRHFNNLCSIQTILQLLLKDLVLVQPDLEDTRLPTWIPKSEHLEDLAKILEFQNSTALNIVSLIWLG